MAPSFRVSQRASGIARARPVPSLASSTSANVTWGGPTLLNEAAPSALRDSERSADCVRKLHRGRSLRVTYPHDARDIVLSGHGPRVDAQPKDAVLDVLRTLVKFPAKVGEKLFHGSAVRLEIQARLRVDHPWTSSFTSRSFSPFA